MIQHNRKARAAGRKILPAAFYLYNFEFDLRNSANRAASFAGTALNASIAALSLAIIANSDSANRAGALTCATSYTQIFVNSLHFASSL